MSGKHRKSKVNDNPENEFLQATVDTLKSTIAKNDLEIKKLKESNEIKAKRIMNLESQLEEARNTIIKHKPVEISSHAHLQPAQSQEDAQMLDGGHQIFLQKQRLHAPHHGTLPFEWQIGRPNGVLLQLR